MSTHRAVLVLAALAAVVGCDKTPLVQTKDLEPHAQDTKSTTPAPATAPPTTDYASAQAGQSDPECLGAFEYTAEQKLTLGGKPATLNGYKLTLGTTPTPVVLGVVASLNDPSPLNLKVWETDLATFKQKGVQAILVDGDSGDTAPAIEGTLKAFAKSGLPILVLIGNREPKGAYLDALAAVRKEAPNVISLNQVREVDFGALTLLSLPGYHDPKYLIAGRDGCQYHLEDLAALKKVAATIKTPILLAAHGMPHQEGTKGIDRTNAPSVNAGDPALTQLLADAHIAFGVFSNIIEAGGQAVNLKGDQVIPQGTPVDSLYLNPGAADSTPWAMNDGSSAKGLAAIFEFKDGKGSYTILRSAPIGPAQKLAVPSQGSGGAAPAPGKAGEPAAHETAGHPHH